MLKQTVAMAGPAVTGGTVSLQVSVEVETTAMFEHVPSANETVGVPIAVNPAPVMVRVVPGRAGTWMLL